MIQGIVQLVAEVMATTSLSNHQVCLSLGVPYDSVVRWQKRHQSGRPLAEQPGPRKIEPLDFGKLKADLAELEHGRYRTAGTSALYAQYAAAISRRDFQEQVEQARADQEQKRRAAMKHIAWHAPGVVWATDDFEYGRNAAGEKEYVHQLRDAASQYVLSPMAGEYPFGDVVAGHLDDQIVQYGAPLFFKRDNGSNLNHQTVDEVLSHHLVIPLNSPPYYPQYNGGMEHAQGEVRTAMDEMLRYKLTRPGEHLEAYARAAAGEWNQCPRRNLNGEHSCAVFDRRWEAKYRFTKPERSAIYDLIIIETIRILAELHDYSQRVINSAWRTAVESFLRWKGFITVTINGKVLPDFNPGFLH